MVIREIEASGQRCAFCREARERVPAPQAAIPFDDVGLVMTP